MPTINHKQFIFIWHVFPNIKNMKKRGRIYIGTSGWHYKHWIGTFYPEGIKDADQLPYYFKVFKTVELNNSFYRLPSPETFASWRKAVPSDFVFAIKGSRYITHQKKLNIEKENISIFFNSAKRLKEKTGPVLFQLPLYWSVNIERFARFLKLLPKNTGSHLNSEIIAGTIMK